MDPLREIQCAVARLGLELWRMAVEEYFSHHESDTANGLLMTMRAIMATGGKPISAAQIARTTGVPYATTRRRLCLLIKDGMVLRVGRKYAPDWAGVARAYPPEKAKRAVRLLCDTCDKLVILTKNI